MADHVDKAGRSRIMKMVQTKNTGPELAVRKILTGLGFRYRLHRKDLPGTPDIVLPGVQTAIFVHGCFWHCHANCKKGRPPKSRPDYWLPKLETNRSNDRRNRQKLRREGWRIIVVWQCELRNPEKLTQKLFSFLCPSNQDRLPQQ